MPVPVRLEVCGLPTALSDTLNVPVLVPVCVGLNTTLIVQLDLAAKLAPQVVAEMLKSPVVEAEMPVSDTFCLLESLKVFAALVLPTFVVGKVALAGVSVAWAVPVPDSGTLCGLFPALSLKVRSPVRDPSCVGVKVTLTVHLAPAASVEPQVLLWMAKSPLVAMLEMSIVADPLLAAVTVFALVVPPTTSLPKANDVGERVRAGAPVTVSCMPASLVKLPDTPLTITVDFPPPAPAATVRVSVLVEVVGFGLNAAVTPLGRSDADNVTLPLKPLAGTTVIVLVPLLPWLTLRVNGLGVSVKYCPVSALIKPESFGLPHPEHRSNPVPQE